MTRHARTAYRRHRKAGIATFVLVFAVGLVVASYPAAAEPPPLVAGTQVNLGGQTGDCTALNPDSAATHDFRVTNPSQSGQFVSYTDPGGATFEVKVTAGNTKLEFRLVGNGYYVNDLVIKGGAKSMHYDYDGDNLIVTTDSNLTGPPKGNTTYSISHVTFCYSEALADIGGHIWNDKDEDGTQDSFESSQAGFLVTVTSDDPNFAPRTDTTDGQGNFGNYLVENLPLGHTYKVCESDPSLAAPNGWAQSVPTTAVCSGAETRGYSINLSADSLNNNFGNTHTVTDICPDGPTQFQVGDDIISISACTKTTPIEYVFETWTETVNNEARQIVNFHPVPGQCVPSGSCGFAYTVERLTWNIDDTQNNILKYDDDGIGVGTELRDMFYCKFDPRNGTDYGLGPNPETSLPDGHTSCLIQSTESADAAAGSKRVDWVFSKVDGLRTLD